MTPPITQKITLSFEEAFLIERGLLHCERNLDEVLSHFENNENIDWPIVIDEHPYKNIEQVIKKLKEINALIKKVGNILDIIRNEEKAIQNQKEAERLKKIHNELNQ